MKHWLALFLIVPWIAFAADGDDVTGVLTPIGKSDYPLTIKLCDTKTSATDCGPTYIPQFKAYKTSIMVYRQNNAGSACTFDNWNVYQLPTSNTTAGYGTPALFTIDDDGTGGLTGVSAGQRLDVYGSLGVYIWIDAGTLGTCDDFSVIMQIHRDN